MITDWASLLALKPLIDTLAMVGMLTGLELFHLAALGEVLEAYAALVLLFGCVRQLVPCFFGNIFDLEGLETLRHFTILFLEGKQLLIRHLIRVRPGVSLALLDGSLNHALLFLLGGPLLTLNMDIGEHKMHHELPLAILLCLVVLRITIVG